MPFTNMTMRMWGKPGKGRFWGQPPMQKTPVRVNPTQTHFDEAHLLDAGPQKVLIVDFSEIELRILAQIEERGLTEDAPAWVREAIEAGKHKA